MRFYIVPKKVEQINDHLFIDTYKSNNIKIGVNNMTVIDRKCVRDEKTKLGQYRRYQSSAKAKQAKQLILSSTAGCRCLQISDHFKLHRVSCPLSLTLLMLPSCQPTQH